MKVSLNWLTDYVRLPSSLEDLAHQLTMAGLEIEGVDRRGAGLAGVVVAQIKESVQHPNADKLSVTQVDAGLGQLLQVVCGAKNYKVGDKVPLATVGTKLPNGVEIKLSSLRGTDSHGMLCSSKELGLTQESSGLLILDPSLPVGTPIAKALFLEDTVLEVNVTPNRADALSHLGIAREVAVLSKGTWAPKSAGLKEASISAAEKIKVRIEEPQRCLRYAARVIEGVKVGPSPMWLQARLEACGIRAINNVVDVTNYVLLEYGQPLHAFDLDALAGSEIVVRLAKPGEKMKTLDGKERALQSDDLLVCDQEKPQVLAGVMGGADSEVQAHTQRILLECAHFQPESVRRSSKRHGLHSESSHRFERGTDVDVIPQVLERAAALISDLGKGVVLRGFVDVFPGKKAARQVTLQHQRLVEVLGVEVPPSDVKRILETLDFHVVTEQPGAWTFEIPSRRQDVSGEEDLIEEVARIWGYDKVPPHMPQGPTHLAKESHQFKVERLIRAALSGTGFDEVVNYSFVSAKELEAVGAPKGIELVNPLSVDQAVMRTTMFSGLLQNVSRNIRHQGLRGRLYELGRIYEPNSAGGNQGTPVALEKGKVAGVLWGASSERNWTAKEQPVDFFDVKGAVEAVLESLHVKSAHFEPLGTMPYHPRAAATLMQGEVVLGSLGELHPRTRKTLDLPEGVFLFELDLHALMKVAQETPSYEGLSKFPSLLRDLAVVVPTELECEAVQKVILEVGAPLVMAARIFDVYTGQPIPEGKKNLAFALEYKSPDRTLTDAEVQQAHGNIVQEVNRRLGGQLRGA